MTIMERLLFLILHKEVLLDVHMELVLVNCLTFEGTYAVRKEH